MCDLDEVVIVFQSAELRRAFSEKMQENGEKAELLVDATHNTQDYNYAFMTLMVLDYTATDRGKGIPVAHALSTQSDNSKKIWSTFASIVNQAMKFDGFDGDKEPSYWPNVLMTDVTSAAFIRLALVFTTLLTHYWCKWHVTEAWLRNINKRVCKDNRKWVYQDLLNLINECNKETFFTKLNGFRARMKDAKENKTLAYLEKTYFGLDKIKKWALCFRIPGFVIHTNNHIESFHRILKVVWFERKRPGRIEFLLEIMLNMEADIVRRYFRIKFSMSKSAGMRASIIDGQETQAMVYQSSGNNTVVLELQSSEELQEREYQTARSGFRTQFRNLQSLMRNLDKVTGVESMRTGLKMLTNLNSHLKSVIQTTVSDGTSLVRVVKAFENKNLVVVPSSKRSLDQASKSLAYLTSSHKRHRQFPKKKGPGRNKNTENVLSKGTAAEQKQVGTDLLRRGRAAAVASLTQHANAAGRGSVQT